MTSTNQEGLDLRILKEKSRQVIPLVHINFMSINGFKCLFARAGFNKIDIQTPGRLDVDLIINSLKAGRLSRKELNPFLDWLIFQAEPDIKQKFQDFLIESQMSSHIWIWARK